MAQGEGTMCCPVFGRTLLLTVEEESPFPCRDRLLGGDGLLTAVQIASQGVFWKGEVWYPSHSPFPVRWVLPSLVSRAAQGASVPSTKGGIQGGGGDLKQDLGHIPWY